MATIGGKTIILNSTVETFFTGTNKVVMRAVDAYDNVYTASISPNLSNSSSYVVEKAGSQMATVRTHNVLFGTTITTPAKLLDRFFAVHAFWTFIAGRPVLELALNIHNSAIDPAQIDEVQAAGQAVLINRSTMADLYFKRVEIVLEGTTMNRVLTIPEYLDNGVTNVLGNNVWTMWREEPGGTPYRIVGTQSDLTAPVGTLHSLHQNAERQHRAVLYVVGGNNLQEAQCLARLEGFGVARASVNEQLEPTWSWQNQNCAGYEVQRHLVPSPESVANIASTIEGLQYTTFFNGLSNGTRINPTAGGLSVDDESTLGYRLGIFHPVGFIYGGSTGGNGIFQTFGSEITACNSTKGILWAMMRDRCANDRSSDGMYTYTGEPLSLEALENPGAVADKFKFLNAAGYGQVWNGFRPLRQGLFNHFDWNSSRIGDLDEPFGHAFALAGASGQYHSIPSDKIPYYVNAPARLLSCASVPPNVDLDVPANKIGATGDPDINDITPILNVYSSQWGNSSGGGAKISTYVWSHITRRVFSLRPLVYLLNDPMAKLKILALAQQERIYLPDKAVNYKGAPATTRNKADKESTFVRAFRIMQASPVSRNRGFDIG